ncbi:MAG: DNA repair protein RecO [Proteobacteria bacterium]|nr:DNA repair protein RecO [Pseudomonadota bacterium]
MSVRRETSRAFLLRSVDYGESDRIVTLFLREIGKISALARGARKSWRRFGGALELFSLSEVTVVPGQGRSRLWRLEEASLISSHAGLARDLNRIGAASFILELVRETIPEHEPQLNIFSLVEEVLPLFEEAMDAAVGLLAIAAELKILALAGMGVSVDHCNACGRPVPDGKKVRFHPARGGVVCTPCGGGPVTLSASVSTALIALAGLPLSRSAEVTLEIDETAELEGALSSFVDHHLGRPLRTRSLFSAASSLRK